MKCYRIAALLLLLFPQINLLFAQTADQIDGCAPFSVNFTPPAGSTSFFWEFGDGSSSNLENPARNYIAPGTYEVIFRESLGGPQVGNSITVTVYEKPEVVLTADPEGGCAPLATSLMAEVTTVPGVNIFNYSWVFGDGNGDVGATLSTVSHTYNNPGNYTVSADITTNFPTCNVLEIEPSLVMVSGPPGVGFITNPQVPVSCDAPFTVAFTNTTLDPTNISEWSWDFDNGQTSSELNPGSQTFTAEGSYTVTLTATDGNGCSGVFSQLVSVGPPTADFMPSQDTICEGALPIPMINNSSAGTYVWTFDNNAFPSTSTQTSPLVEFRNPGVTNITLTVTSPDGQCSSMTTGQVFVDDPNAAFESIPTYSCTNILNAQFVPENTMAAQYIWSFEGGGTSDEMSPTFTYENLDTTTHGINGLNEFTTTLTVVSNAGCTATTTVIDTIHPPNALFYPDITEGCAPLTVVFENRSTNDVDLVEFVWDFGEGPLVTVNNDDDQTYEYDTPGEYEVVLIATDEMGCMDTSFVQIIQVGGPLTPSFTVTNSTICPGESITVEDMTNSDLIDAWHFATDANRSFHCYQEDELTHVFGSETGVFDITLVVEYNGCYSEVTQADAITVNGPIAHMDYLVDCTDPFNISFADSSDDATAITWDFGDLQTSTDADPMHMYADTGVYQVILTATNDGNNCPASSDTMDVFIRDIKADFDLDSLLCLGLPYDLDGSGSVNVDADCHTGYTWYFSDPNDRPITTQETVVEHVFEQRGINYVTLITDDINGCRDTIIDTVKVFGVFPELIGTPTPICIPGTVSFSSMGTTADTTIDNYMWDFGDGNMSEDINPTHEYTTPPPNGTSYAVTLSVSDVIPCSGLGQLDIPVYVPTSTITAAPKVDICVGETIDFTASDFTAQGSNLTWSWNFGSGASPTTSTNQSQSVTYNVAGSYQVILNYQEAGSDCLGIPDTINVTVQEYPMAAFTSVPDVSTEVLCSSEQIAFTDNSSSSSPVSVNWLFSGGLTATGVETSQTFTPGSYTVTQTVATLNGCSDEAMLSFEIQGPEGDFDTDATAICYGSEITFTLKDTMNVGFWQWDFGDGVVEDGSPGSPSSVTHTYSDSLAGQITVISLVLFDGNGDPDDCTVIISDTLMFSSLDLGISGPGSAKCVGEAINFSAVTSSSSTIEYDWDLGDGTNEMTQSFSHTYENTGTYNITLAGVDAMGCTDNVEATIIIEEKPVISVEDQSVCGLDQVNLEVNIENPQGLIISWDPANLVENPDQANTQTIVAASNLTTTQFDITVSSPNGCETMESLMVDVTDEFIVPNIDTVNVCPGSEKPLPGYTPNAGYQISWTISGIEDPSKEQSIKEGLERPTPMLNIPIFDKKDNVESFTITLQYDVNGTTGNCSGSHNIVVNLLSTTIPNAFTPDNDGLNDFFNIDVSEFYEVKTFQIFNRWGQKIYDNDTPATGWDGMLNGKLAPSEVYIFNFETTNEECVFKGNLSLIR